MALKTRFLRCACQGGSHVGRTVRVKGETRVKWEGWEFLEHFDPYDKDQTYITEEEYIRGLLAGEII